MNDDGDDLLILFEALRFSSSFSSLVYDVQMDI